MANPYLTFLQDLKPTKEEQLLGFVLRLTDENKEIALRTIRRMYVLQQEAERRKTVPDELNNVISEADLQKFLNDYNNAD